MFCNERTLGAWNAVLAGFSVDGGGLVSHGPALPNNRLINKLCWSFALCRMNRCKCHLCLALKKEQKETCGDWEYPKTERGGKKKKKAPETWLQTIGKNTHTRSPGSCWRNFHRSLWCGGQSRSMLCNPHSWVSPHQLFLRLLAAREGLSAGDCPNPEGRRWFSSEIALPPGVRTVNVALSVDGLAPESCRRQRERATVVF